MASDMCWDSCNNVFELFIFQLIKCNREIEIVMLKINEATIVVSESKFKFCIFL